MQRPQLELWSAEPHSTPPIYQQLTPQQRSSLISASPEPRNGPCVAMAMEAYSEQEGKNLHPPVPSECRAGDSHRR